MAALSGAMHAIRLSGALLMDTQLPGQWCYQTPRPEALWPDFMPGERVLAFHLVVDGTCVAFLPGRPPVETQAGELLLFAQGEQHILASSMTALETLRPCEVRCDALRSTGAELLRSELASTRLICGYLSCCGEDAVTVRAAAKPDSSAGGSALLRMDACLFCVLRAGIG